MNRLVIAFTAFAAIATAAVLLSGQESCAQVGGDSCKRCCASATCPYKGNCGC